MAPVPAMRDSAGDSDAASVLDRSRPQRLAPNATAQAILTAIGETVYEWDIPSDRIRWGGNVADLFGITDTRALSTSASYDSLLHPDSFTNRHQAVLNGIGVDYGDGVPYDVTYALRLATEGGLRTLWVHDCGVWFADADGTPYLARGVVRLIRNAVGRSSAKTPSRELPRRGAFLRILNGILAMAAHYKTAHAFVALSVDNLPLVARSYGVPAIEELEAAIGDRVRAAVRGADVVGWLSECELGLIIAVGDASEADQAVERIIRALASPLIETSAGMIGPVVAAGVVIAPFQAASLEECLSRARLAQTYARAKGPGRHVFFDAEPGMRPPGHSEAEVALVVQRALRDQSAELELHSVVRTADGKEAYVAASPTFPDGRGGKVSWPDALPIVRALGLSKLVDALVVDLAIKFLTGKGDAVLSVPVSADLLRDQAAAEELSAKLASAGVNAERLILTIGEAEVGGDHEALQTGAAAIRRLGCGLTLTEFGAGPASARILRILQANRVRLDSVVTRADGALSDDLSFAPSLMEVARALGAEVIAESGIRSVVGSQPVDYLELIQERAEDAAQRSAGARGTVRRKVA